MNRTVSLLIAIVFMPIYMAEGSENSQAGIVTNLVGKVHRVAAKGSKEVLKKNSFIYAGDKLLTDKRSFVKIFSFHQT
ncbi:MAG: hypothetical protein L3J12_06100 [Spirochaetales bacterium]|nr:hypothetical protein [Spirochaetales bacterium]